MEWIMCITTSLDRKKKSLNANYIECSFAEMDIWISNFKKMCTRRSYLLFVCSLQLVSVILSLYYYSQHFPASHKCMQNCCNTLRMFISYILFSIFSIFFKKKTLKKIDLFFSFFSQTYLRYCESGYLIVCAIQDIKK